jgi:TonB family protein
MKRVRIALLLFLMSAACSLAEAQDASSWIQVASGEELFTALMPRKASVDVKKSTFGSLNVSGKRYATSDDDTAYIVWSFVNSDFPRHQFRDSSEYLDTCADLLWESLLKPRREELPKKKEVLARMTYVREITDSPLPGREYQINLGEVAGVTRVYARDARIYVLVALSNSPGAAKASGFFNSFTMKPTLPTPAVLAGDPVGIGSGVRGGDESGADYNRVFGGRETSEKVRILAKPEPSYTESARKYGVQGTVILRAVFSKEGEVTKIYVLRRLPHGLTEQALAAARQIRFTPALKDGHAVSQYMQLEYNFNLY